MSDDVREALTTSGWAVVDLLDDTELAAARAVVRDAGLTPDHGFFASPAMAWGPIARSVDQQLKAIVADSAGRVLPGLRPFMAAITSKGAGSATVIPFHQDWTYTDERRWRATFLWCPLVDTDVDNGTLHVVAGSHAWSEHLRPSRLREASLDLEDDLAARAEAVPLQAGQALAFDPATFHGSEGNRTERARPAITVAFVPPEATLLHFHEHPDGRIEGFQVDDRFFTENTYRARPVGYPTVTPHAPVLTQATLRSAMERRPADAA